MSSPGGGDSKKKTLLERMAQIEAEKEAHRAMQAEKDRKFKAALAAIETQSVRETYTLDDTKRELRESFEMSGRKEEKRRREERLREVERETASNELKERLAMTWHNLELNSTAHELDAWCAECGCIHTSDVVNDDL